MTILTKMEAQSTDQKTFSLTHNGEHLGKLTYESIFSHRASIQLSTDEVYELHPKGVFGTRISVTKNATEYASLSMNWRGQIVFSVQDRPELIFKPKGIFSNKYTLENQSGEILLQLDPQFNWSKFNYNYHISYETPPEEVLLALLGVYASNYYIAAMAGQM